METQPTMTISADLLSRFLQFMDMGGGAMWAIALLSVFTLALIIWKIMRLLSLGVFSAGGHTRKALEVWADRRHEEAIALLQGKHSLRARLARSAMMASLNQSLDRTAAEAETTRIARGLLAQTRSGLRGLELASTIGPLLGLLGTVTGMIIAFQALQEAGTRADPAMLAGGIWEALITTAAGMAVAIPAQVSLTWFESITDRLRHDMEDSATFILHTAHPETVSREAVE
jgi:biopolymer transport protein ExbB